MERIGQISSCERRSVSERVSNRMRTRLGTDRMKSSNAPTFLFIFLRVFWVSNPAKFCKPAMVLVQRPTKGRMLGKKQLSVPVSN